MMMRWLSVIVVVIATFYFMDIVNSCNEAVCASVVSKCMLTQSCKCDLSNCSCCKDCFSCLGELYSECCSCVDMCPKPNDTGSALSKKSHVEDFNDPIPALFEALTAEPDTQKRWITFTFPVDFDMVSYRPKIQIKYYTQSNEQEVAPTKDIITLNCTVAYMSQCMSWNKCKQSCKSTGAVSYRWFHDGCCECIGETCINYGINESRCLDCPEKKDDLSTEEDDSSYTYDYPEYEDEASNDR